MNASHRLRRVQLLINAITSILEDFNAVAAAAGPRAASYGGGIPGRWLHTIREAGVSAGCLVQPVTPSCGAAACAGAGLGDGTAANALQQLRNTGGHPQSIFHASVTRTKSSGEHGAESPHQSWHHARSQQSQEHEQAPRHSTPLLLLQRERQAASAAVEQQHPAALASQAVLPHTGRRRLLGLGAVEAQKMLMHVPPVQLRAQHSVSERLDAPAAVAAEARTVCKDAVAQQEQEQSLPARMPLTQAHTAAEGQATGHASPGAQACSGAAERLDHAYLDLLVSGQPCGEAPGVTHAAKGKAASRARQDGLRRNVPTASHATPQRGAAVAAQALPGPARTVEQAVQVPPDQPQQQRRQPPPQDQEHATAEGAPTAKHPEQAQPYGHHNRKVRAPKDRQRQAAGTRGQQLAALERACSVDELMAWLQGGGRALTGGGAQQTGSDTPGRIWWNGILARVFVARVANLHIFMGDTLLARRALIAEAAQQWTGKARAREGSSQPRPARQALPVAASPQDAVELLAAVRKAVGGDGADLDPELVRAVAVPHVLAVSERSAQRGNELPRLQKATSALDAAAQRLALTQDKAERAQEELQRQERAGAWASAAARQAAEAALAEAEAEVQSAREVREKEEDRERNARLLAIQQRTLAICAVQLGTELARAGVMPPGHGLVQPPPSTALTGEPSAAAAAGVEAAAVWSCISDAVSYLCDAAAWRGREVPLFAALRVETELAVAAAQRRQPGWQLYESSAAVQAVLYMLRQRRLANTEEVRRCLSAADLERLARRVEQEEALANVTVGRIGVSDGAGGSDGSGGGGVGPQQPILWGRRDLLAATRRGEVRNWLLGLVEGKAEALFLAADQLPKRPAQTAGPAATRLRHGNNDPWVSVQPMTEGGDPTWYRAEHSPPQRQRQQPPEESARPVAGTAGPGKGDEASHQPEPPDAHGEAIASARALARACLALEKRAHRAAEDAMTARTLGHCLQDLLGQLMLEYHGLATHIEESQPPSSPGPEHPHLEQQLQHRPQTPSADSEAVLEFLLIPHNTSPPLSLRQAITSLLKAPGADGAAAWRAVPPASYDTLLRRLMAQPINWRWPPPGTCVATEPAESAACKAAEHTAAAGAASRAELDLVEQEAAALGGGGGTSPPPLPSGLAEVLSRMARAVQDAEEELRYDAARRASAFGSGMFSPGEDGGADVAGWSSEGQALDVQRLHPQHGPLAAGHLHDTALLPSERTEASPGADAGDRPVGPTHEGDWEPVDTWRLPGTDASLAASAADVSVPAETAFGLVHLAGELLRRAAPPPGTAAPPSELQAPAAALLAASSRLLVQLVPPDLPYAYAIACQYGSVGQVAAEPVVLEAMARGLERGVESLTSLLHVRDPPPPPPPREPFAGQVGSVSHASVEDGVLGNAVADGVEGRIAAVAAMSSPKETLALREAPSPQQVAELLVQGRVGRAWLEQQEQALAHKRYDAYVRRARLHEQAEALKRALREVNAREEAVAERRKDLRPRLAELHLAQPSKQHRQAASPAVQSEQQKQQRRMDARTAAPGQTTKADAAPFEELLQQKDECSKELARLLVQGTELGARRRAAQDEIARLKARDLAHLRPALRAVRQLLVPYRLPYIAERQAQLAAVAEVLAEQWYVPPPGSRLLQRVGTLARLLAGEGAPLTEHGGGGAGGGGGARPVGQLDLRFACAAAWLLSVRVSGARLLGSEAAVAAASEAGAEAEVEVGEGRTAAKDGDGSGDGLRVESGAGLPGKWEADAATVSVDADPALSIGEDDWASEAGALTVPDDTGAADGPNSTRGRVLELLHKVEEAVAARLAPPPSPSPAAAPLTAVRGVGNGAELPWAAIADAAGVRLVNGMDDVTALAAAATKARLAAGGVSGAREPQREGDGGGGGGGGGFLSLRSAYALTAACWNVGVMPPMLRHAVSEDVRAAAMACTTGDDAASALAAAPAGGRGRGRSHRSRALLQQLFVSRVLGHGSGASQIPDPLAVQARSALDLVPYEGRMQMALQLLDSHVISPLEAIELLRTEVLQVLPKLRDPDRLARLARLMVGPELSGASDAGRAATVDATSDGNGVALLPSSAAASVTPALPAPDPASAAPGAASQGDALAPVAAAAAAELSATLKPSAAAAGAPGRVAVLAAAALPALAAEAWVPLEVLRTICSGVHTVDLTDEALDALTARLLRELSDASAAAAAAAAPAASPMKGGRTMAQAQAAAADGGGRGPVRQSTLSALRVACRETEREALLEQIAQVWLHQVYRRQLRREHVITQKRGRGHRALLLSWQQAQARAFAEAQAQAQMQDKLLASPAEPSTQGPSEQPPRAQAAADVAPAAGQESTAPAAAPGAGEDPRSAWKMAQALEALEKEQVVWQLKDLLQHDQCVAQPAAGRAGADDDGVVAEQEGRDRQVGHVLLLLTDPVAARPLAGAAAGSPVGAWPLVTSIALRADLLNVQRFSLADRLLHMLQPPRRPLSAPPAATTLEAPPFPPAAIQGPPGYGYGSSAAAAAETEVPDMAPPLPPQLPLMDAARVLSSCLALQPETAQARRSWARVVEALLPPLAARGEELAAQLVRQHLAAAAAATAIPQAEAGRGASQESWAHGISGEWGPDMLPCLLRTIAAEAEHARSLLQLRSEARAAADGSEDRAAEVLELARAVDEAPYGVCLARQYSGALQGIMAAVLRQAMAPVPPASPAASEPASDLSSGPATVHPDATNVSAASEALAAAETRARVSLVMDCVRAAAEQQSLQSLACKLEMAALQPPQQQRQQQQQRQSSAAPPAAAPLPGLEAASSFVAERCESAPLERLLQFGRDMEALGGTVPWVVPLLECAALLPALRQAKAGLEHLRVQLQALAHTAGWDEEAAAAAEQEAAKAPAQWSVEWRRLLGLLSQANQVLGAVRFSQRDGSRLHTTADGGSSADSSASLPLGAPASALPLSLLKVPAELLHTASAALAACEGARRALAGGAFGSGHTAATLELVTSAERLEAEHRRMLSWRDRHLAHLVMEVAAASAFSSAFGADSTDTQAAAASALARVLSLDSALKTPGPLERFGLAMAAAESLHRRGLTHDELTRVALRLAGAAFLDAAEAPGGGGGNGGGGRAAVADALRQVALPALRLHVEAGMAQGAGASGAGGDAGGAYDMYGGSGHLDEHPLEPLLLALESKAAAILEVATPPRRRPTPLGLKQAPVQSSTAADAAASTGLTVNLLLAFVRAGYLQGRLPNALADIIIASVLAAPAEELPYGGSGGAALGCMTAAQLQELLMASTAVVHIDGGGGGGGRWGDMAHGATGEAAAADIDAVADVVGPTLGHQLLCDVMRTLAESGALDAAASPRSRAERWTARDACSPAALMRLAHALSRRGSRSGLHGTAAARLLGRLYSGLVAEAEAEAEAGGVVVLAPPEHGGQVAAAAVVATHGSERALDLLRLAACGRNLGDVSLWLMAEARLEAELRRIAATRDPGLCAALLEAIDDIVREADPWFGMSLPTSSSNTWPPTSPSAAVAARLRPSLYGIGGTVAPARDVLAVLRGADPTLAEALAEVVEVGAPGLTIEQTASVMEWAAATVAAGPVQTASSKTKAAAGKALLPQPGIAAHGVSQRRLAAAWSAVMDGWLRVGREGAAAVEDRSGGSGSGDGAAATARTAPALQEPMQASVGAVGPAQAALSARGAVSLLAVGEALGCSDPRDVQALSQVVLAALEVEDGGDAGGELADASP